MAFCQPDESSSSHGIHQSSVSHHVSAQQPTPIQSASSSVNTVDITSELPISPDRHDPVSSSDVFPSDASMHALPPLEQPTEVNSERVPASMPLVPLPHSEHLQGFRIFLDICCGVNSPLSNAVKLFHGDFMRFDILVHTTDDLLNALCFEQLLRVCASGIVAYAAASPSCCQYSRLRLLPNGPPAVRTPQFLDGIPGLSGHELLRVQESSIMLERCIQCLQVTITSSLQGVTGTWSSPNRR